MRRRHLALSSVAVCAAVLPLCATGTAVATVTAAAPSHQVVVASLNNPRQLSITGDGTLLVAEAGKGGDLAIVNNPEEGTQGIGLTGAIAAVSQPATATDSAPNRIVTGLISGASLDGSYAVGSDGVSAMELDNIAIQETAAPAGVTLPPAAQGQDGKLLRSTGTGDVQVVADIAGYERNHNPDGQDVDSDPYAVLQLPGYRLVADAAANDVLRVDQAGRISLWRVFDNIVNDTCLDPSLQQPAPNLPGCQFVPDALAVDRQGNVYVGGLGGLVPGQGEVVELTADGSRVLHTWTGFTGVTGVAVDPAGTLYVSQLFAPESAPAAPGLAGVLTRITATGDRSDADVPFPAGVATDQAGNVYVSAFSTSPDSGMTDWSTGARVPGTSGQVWRLHW